MNISKLDRSTPVRRPLGFSGAAVGLLMVGFGTGCASKNVASHAPRDTSIDESESTLGGGAPADVVPSPPEIGPPRSVTLKLPACGPDPEENRRTIQTAIDHAPDGATLVLPPGRCVVAKCGVADNTICRGVIGSPHYSALYVGSKSGLLITGNAGSVLKLDPNPPGAKPRQHPYCHDTHLLTIELSRFVVMNGFGLDGSDADLPNTGTECPPTDEDPGHLQEQMHLIRAVNATDLTFTNLKLNGAHGDAIRLIAERSRATALVPSTQRVSITNDDFVANRRSGVAFQRNVAHVSIDRCRFQGTVHGQDIDMEPSGRDGDDGPFSIGITHNSITHGNPSHAVALGGAGSLLARDINFAGNRVASTTPGSTDGACILVYDADNVWISDNAVGGGTTCSTIRADRTTRLTVSANQLDGYGDFVDGKSGVFDPAAVVDVRWRAVDLPGCTATGPCVTRVYYPDDATITGNTIVQHVQDSPGVRVDSGNSVIARANVIVATNELPPVGTLPPHLATSGGISLPYGLPNHSRADHTYENERRSFLGASVGGNRMGNFVDGVKVLPHKPGITLDSAQIDQNRFDSVRTHPIGIHILPVAEKDSSAVVPALEVTDNVFGCGFNPANPPPANAFVRPDSQTYTGNIGVSIGCVPQ